MSKHWHRLRRLFHLEGNLGGLRYEARFGIFELQSPDTLSRGNDVVPPPQRELPVDSSAAEPSTRFFLDVWESEGGASRKTKH